MAQGATQTSMLLPMLVFNTLQKMILNKAEGNREKYWYFFTSLCRLMKPHVKTSYRTKMQEEYKKLQGIIKDVKDSDIHDDSKLKQILEIQFIYADNRESIIYDALPNIGLGPDILEGEIDFKKIDIEKLAALVQGKEGFVAERSSEVLGEAKNEPEEKNKPEEQKEPETHE